MAGTAEFYQRQQLLARAVADRATDAWGLVEGGAISESWVAALPPVIAAVTVGQIAAAAPAPGYVDAAVRAAGETPAPDGRVDPQAFAGSAADGRPLASLLYLPAVTAKQRIAEGLPLAEAMLAGLAQLVMLTSMQVRDAGRTAAGVAVTNDRTVAGYVRVVNSPSCSRCTVLAGRLYRWSKGFQRHPRCDCTMAPVTEQEWRQERPGNTPRRLFDSMTDAQLHAGGFSAADITAIRDGADLSQVVNASRGMSTANVFGHDLQVTSEGTTRRGLAGPVKQPRLTPESIYEIAADRAHAIELLRKYRYII